MEAGLDILKVFGVSALTFFIGVFITPILAHYLYKYKAWRKTEEKKALLGGVATIVNSLYAEKRKNQPKTPRMGGILIWTSTLIITILFFLIPQFFPSEFTQKLNFLSRSQTWLPLFGLISASVIGLVDDIFVIRGKGKYVGGGLTLKQRIILVSLIGLIGGWWFYDKLDVSAIFIPYIGEVVIGWLLVPFFIIVMLASFSGGVIDGLDGLSGGIFAAIFAAFTGIAFFQNQIDLAAFCAALTGATLAFLWFNIPPARFYMGETGILGLTTVLTIVAFLTDAVLVLPIIAFPLVMASGSAILQMFSRKLRGKKLFLAAPIHHHFEAKGWPDYKVTMRFWVIAVVFAIIGMVIVLTGQ